MQNLNYRFDVLLLSSWTSNDQVGWYTTGTGLAEMIWYLPTAIGIVLLPVMVGMKADEGNLLTARTSRWSLFLMFLGILSLLVVSPLLVRMLYGEAFLPSVPVLYALAVGILTNGLFQILGIYLASRKMLGQLTLLTTMGFLVNLILNIFLIPRWGIVGAGLSSSVSYTVSGFLTAWVFHRTTQIKWMDFLFIKREDLADLRSVVIVLFQRLRPDLRKRFF
jgi:O-antigen/teichoic acid export membrane protein